ncbi:DNA adenine methylase [Mariprofundus ferrooxydans]|uniref:DNA adenine methylase n=1 Tax=Mariprofundus ferrooxydans TaxID=314344 RepID=UPI001430EAF6|nr:Dam family site-specific DNA-(adenine-N6)-methyltransferase [Mariprofundus ferrooxydans]
MKAKPFLRWAGSKRKLVPYLSTYWDNSFERYIEPFMGSAVLYYELDPNKAILSDINKELIQTFTEIKNNPKEVHKTLSALNPDKENYYAVRATDSESLNSVERAARFIYLNRFCFNGLYRTNQKGKFNVPFAPSGTGNIPTVEHLELASKKLANTELLAEDFESVLIRHVKAGDFVYLDPPYATNSKRVFREYGPGSFCVDDLDRLQKILSTIDQRGAHFVLSYGSCPEALDTFSNWKPETVSVQRNISGFVKGRRKSEELVFTNII